MRQREEEVPEQYLARSSAACPSCHSAKDPWGSSQWHPTGAPLFSAVPARTPRPLEHSKKPCCWAAMEPQPQNRRFSPLQHQLLHHTVALAELQTYSFTCQAWISSYVRVELHVQYFPYFQRLSAICFYYGSLWHRIPQTLQYLFLFCAAVMVAVLLYEQNDKTWSLLNSLLSTPIFFVARCRNGRIFYSSYYYDEKWFERIWNL